MAIIIAGHWELSKSNDMQHMILLNLLRKPCRWFRCNVTLKYIYWQKRIRLNAWLWQQSQNCLSLQHIDSLTSDAVSRTLKCIWVFISFNGDTLVRKQIPCNYPESHADSQKSNSYNLQTAATNSLVCKTKTASTRSYLKVIGSHVDPPLMMEGAEWAESVSC